MTSQRPRRRWLLAAVVVVLLAVAGVIFRNRQQPSTADRAARTLAAHFLATWVDADGRVVRRDQGNDSVSEGQAYGMLLAVTAGDRAKFDTIWSWTRMHLQQPDGLLAWRWVDGKVADEQSAADADIDAAWALALAGRKFGDSHATSSGRALAAAALARETVATQSGRVLVAGPWAIKSPATVNPSYLVGGTASMLSRLTGDREWDSVATATRRLDGTLVNSALPPDWASVHPDQSSSGVTPAGSPDGSAGPRYGLDAPRLLIRLASSCDSADRALAASASRAVGSLGEPAIRSLSGEPQVSWRHPISDVAVAAVASAAGDRAGVTSALSAAERAQATTPTYYGAAWIALGAAMLTTRTLTDCAASTS